jgi:hypothetical protein
VRGRRGDGCRCGVRGTGTDAQPIVGQGITFLNADVEGYEKQVLSSLDFTRTGRASSWPNRPRR